MSNNDYLVHHGVKGQVWGRRRYQNYDGSYKKGAEGRYDPEPGSNRRNPYLPPSENSEKRSNYSGKSIGGPDIPPVGYGRTPYLPPHLHGRYSYTAKNGKTYYSNTPILPGSNHSSTYKPDDKKKTSNSLGDKITSTFNNIKKNVESTTSNYVNKASNSITKTVKETAHNVVNATRKVSNDVKEFVNNSSRSINKAKKYVDNLLKGNTPSPLSNAGTLSIKSGPSIKLESVGKNSKIQSQIKNSDLYKNVKDKLAWVGNKDDKKSFYAPPKGAKGNFQIISSNGSTQTIGQLSNAKERFPAHPINYSFTSDHKENNKKFYKYDDNGHRVDIANGGRLDNFQKAERQINKAKSWLKSLFK